MLISRLFETSNIVYIMSKTKKKKDNFSRQNDIKQVKMSKKKLKGPYYRKPFPSFYRRV